MYADIIEGLTGIVYTTVITAVSLGPLIYCDERGFDGLIAML